MLIAAAPASATLPDSDVPAESPVREALRRLETRTATVLPLHSFPSREGSLPGPGPGFTPYDSALVAAEYPALRRPLLDWRDAGRGHSLRLSPEVRGAASWRDAGDDGSAADTGGPVLLTGIGLTATGRLLPRLGFYTHGMVYTENTARERFTHQFDPDFGETYSVEKGPGDTLLADRTFNRFESYATVDLPFVRLKAGRDRIHAGPGYFTSLTATRETPPYWLLEARVDFAPWLSLDNLLLKMTDSDHDVRKYANLHRFEFRPARGLALAFQDIVIYQDRGPDWAYVLPLVPLTFAEADNGGRDNAAMGGDFLWTALPGLSFWGELFLDDLLGPGSFFDDFWENRWAVLAGFQAASPWRAVDADLVVEWGRVEPWTYNGRKDHTSFRHFDVPSASRLGPDSRALDVQASWRPFRWLQARSRAAWTEKGLGRPGTLGAIHDDAVDGTRKAFLSGPTQYRSRYLQELAFLWGGRIQGRVFLETVTETEALAVGADWTARW